MVQKSVAVDSTVPKPNDEGPPQFQRFYACLLISSFTCSRQVTALNQQSPVTARNLQKSEPVQPPRNRAISAGAKAQGAVAEQFDAPLGIPTRVWEVSRPYGNNISTDSRC